MTLSFLVACSLLGGNILIADANSLLNLKPIRSFRSKGEKTPLIKEINKIGQEYFAGTDFQTEEASPVYDSYDVQPPNEIQEAYDIQAEYDIQPSQYEDFSEYEDQAASVKPAKPSTSPETSTTTSRSTTTTYTTNTTPSITTPTSTTTPPSLKFKEVFGFNLAGRIRLDWEAMEQYILTLAQHQGTQQLIQEMVDANPCVSSIEAYNAFLEQGVRIIENFGPEIENMILTLLSLRGERNITVMTSKSAEILLHLNVIHPQITSIGCNASPEVGVAALRDLALVLYKMSLLDEVPLMIFTTPIQETLRRSSQIVEALSNAVDHLWRNLAEIDCYTSTDSMRDFIFLAAETMSDMAEVLGALDNFEEAKELRQYASFVRSIQDSVGTLDEFKVPGDCSPGGLGRASKTLQDLSNILADVGLQELAINVGVSFRHDLLP